ncbi:MAG: helix-turn-helix transcriptional regulator, partial [Hungatella sp.]
EKVLFNAFISIPCDFIEDLVRDMKQSTLLILDKNGVLQKQFGSHLPISPDTPFSIPEHSTMTALKFQDTSYICTYLKSDVADWYYAICTPNTLFLQEAIHIRNAALFTIFSTLFLGLISIVILQVRNYRPLRKIMGTIPANLKNKQNDEFELLENYYHELHEENRTMRQSISSRADYAKEIFLLSKLKGRDFYLSESDVSEFLGIDYSGKHFAIVSIYADFEAPSFQDSSVNVFDLMSFSISNVLDEVLDSAYPYQKTIDEVFFVYLFILDPPSLALWEEDSGQKFEQIYEFFKSNFHLDLSITISRTFDRFEYLASNYTDILNAFEYRYVIEQYGVLSVDSLQGIDFGALERLEKYKRQFNVSLSQHDYETADRLFHNLFEAFSGSEESLYSCQYYILSITSSMLFTFRNSMNAKIDNRILEQHLFQLTTCNSLAQMQSAFGGVLKLLYGMLDLNSEPEGNVEQLMTKVQLYVEEHYTDGNMNISSIAEAIGLTPKYISKLFKDTTSEGLLSYINHVRIEHAKELLRTTDCTIDEISFRVGFTNSRSFRRNFLKITGQTPTDFRK